MASDPAVSPQEDAAPPVDLTNQAWHLMDRIYKKVCEMTPGQPQPTTAFYDFGVPILADALKPSLLAVPDGKSLEQQARDMLERMGVEDAQSFTTGDVIELANLIAERNRLNSAVPDGTLRELVEKWRAEAATDEPDIAEAEQHGLLVTAASASSKVGHLRTCADELDALLASVSHPSEGQ